MLAGELRDAWLVLIHRRKCCVYTFEAPKLSGKMNTKMVRNVFSFFFLIFSKMGLFGLRF